MRPLIHRTAGRAASQCRPAGRDTEVGGSCGLGGGAAAVAARPTGAEECAVRHREPHRPPSAAAPLIRCRGRVSCQWSFSPRHPESGRTSSRRRSVGDGSRVTTSAECLSDVGAAPVIRLSNVTRDRPPVRLLGPAGASCVLDGASRRV